MLLHVTMTAVQRAELLRATLTSFGDLLFADAARKGWQIAFFVNVDPVGPDGSFSPVQELFKEFSFVHAAYFHFAPGCNFGRAVQTAWRMSQDAPCPGLILHLEDDWQLSQPVDLQQVAVLFRNHTRLASLRLPVAPSQTDSIDIGDNVVFPWNGEYFRCPDELVPRRAISLNPTFFAPSFLYICRMLLNPEMNPEKQFWYGNERLSNYIRNWDHGIYGKPGNKPVVSDIGRAWRSRHGYEKENDDFHFLRWVKR